MKTDAQSLLSDPELFRSLLLAERARHSETPVRIADERDAALSESDCLRAIIEAMQRHHSGRRPEPLDFDPLGFGLEGTEQALAAAKAKGESQKATPALEPAKRQQRLKTPFAAQLVPTEQLPHFQEGTINRGFKRYATACGIAAAAGQHSGDENHRGRQQ